MISRPNHRPFLKDAGHSNCSRRMALRSLASGFGYLAFAGLAHAAANQPGDTQSGIQPRPTHFAPRHETRDFSMHEWRSVSRGSAGL